MYDPYQILQMQQLMAMGSFIPPFAAGQSQSGLPPPVPQTTGASSSEDDDDDEDNEEKRTLFCANLDERVTEELLYEVFLQAGPLESARIPKDSVGRQRSFGFVTYVHQCSVPYAMQLFQGLALYRKTVAIKFQGSTNPPPLKRHSLPSNSDQSYQQRTNFDNSALRSGHFLTFNESNFNGPSSGGIGANPFKKNISSDWVLGSSGRKERVAHSRSHHHHPTGPYHRHSAGDVPHDRGRERDRDVDLHGGHDKRRHHHNGSNRHSDQRSNRRR